MEIDTINKAERHRIDSEKRFRKMDSSYLNKAFNRLIRKRQTLEEINGRETTLGCKLGGKTSPDQLK